MSAFVNGDAVRLADFSRICAQRTNASDYPLCLEVQGNVPIYQATPCATATAWSS